MDARLAITLSLSLSLCAAARPNRKHPRPAPQSKDISDHIKNAEKLLKAGDHGAALIEYRAAWDRSHAWELMFDIGLLEKRLLNWGNALEALNRYLDEGGTKVPKDKRARVARELTQIHDSTATVRVRIKGPPAKISLDGQVVGLTPIAPLFVGPGKHTFSALREGDYDEETVDLVAGIEKEVVLAPKTRAEREQGELTIDTSPKEAIITVDGRLAGIAPTKLKLDAGKHEIVAELNGFPTRKVEVELAVAESRELLVSFDHERATPDGPTAAAASKFHLVGVIVAGAGLVLLGTGIGLNVAAHGEARQVSAIFSVGGTWDKQAQLHQTAGLAAETWSWVFTIAGGAALAAGGVLIVLHLLPRPKSPDETALWLAPSPGGLVFGGTW